MKCHYLGCHETPHFVVGRFDTWITTCDKHLVRYAKLVAVSLTTDRMTLKVIGES